MSDAKGEKAARFTLAQRSDNKEDRLTIPVVMFNQHGAGIPWMILKRDTAVKVRGRLRNNDYFGTGRIEILAKEIVKAEE